MTKAGLRPRKCRAADARRFGRLSSDNLTKNRPDQNRDGRDDRGMRDVSNAPHSLEYRLRRHFNFVGFGFSIAISSSVVAQRKSSK